MTLVAADVAISRPPAEVFSYVTDPARFGEWQSGVVSGHIEGDQPPRVGSRFTSCPAIFILKSPVSNTAPRTTALFCLVGVLNAPPGGSSIRTEGAGACGTDCLATT